MSRGGCCQMGGSPAGDSGKQSTCQCRRCAFNPRVGRTPWRGKWQPTPVFLPGASHGQWSLVGLSPWGHRGSDMQPEGRVCVLVTQSCPALCDPLDCDSPGSSVLGIFQVRILEWAAMSSSTEGHGRPSLLG